MKQSIDSKVVVGYDKMIPCCLAENLDRLDTYKIGGVNLVTHFLFTDDVLCFTKVNHKSVHALKEVDKFF